MSVFTLVQRALPFPLSWKRRPSASSSKGKEKDDGLYFDTSDHDSHLYHDPEKFSVPFTEVPRSPLHSDTVHIAVKQKTISSFPVKSEYSPSEYSETSPEPVSEFDPPGPRMKQRVLSLSRSRSQSTRFCREVSWASIVSSRCRWTNEQEKELVMARKQLARCQKAWSSEQELWLSYIEELNEEKEAHEGFMLMRMRQQEDERNQFRKAWKRRRSIEDPVQEKKILVTVSGGNNNDDDGIQKVRRFHLPVHGYLSHNPNLATSASQVACQV
ncbi:hypothetical protein N7478_009727 [Penicillium angulare]|uniref:uncharacterized protein n=1 Tax=Penicillium angulare TaxID=116970 RepID=UPI002540BE4C|nr:uncharacterized protein N7478_009727 [Penicillium angulare]KAJ5266919.1 hypothetical protein N7478_009727 [Penicillium angulare]